MLQSSPILVQISDQFAVLCLLRLQLDKKRDLNGNKMDCLWHLSLKARKLQRKKSFVAVIKAVHVTILVDQSSCCPVS